MFISPHELPKRSVDKIGELDGFFVMIFIIPPTASDPYKVEAGPFTTSTLSINAWGIPVNPYTVESPLTIGIPSIRTKV